MNDKIEINIQKNLKIDIQKNSKESYTKGITGLEIIKKKKYKNIIGVCINKKIEDTVKKIEKSSELEFITNENKKSKKILQKTGIEILGKTINKLYPKIKIIEGSIKKNEFFYDIDLDETSIKEVKINKIEKNFLKIAQRNTLYEILEIEKKNIKEYFKEEKYEYILKIASEKKKKKIKIYKNENFINLYNGPYTSNTNFIKAIKIINISGVYWKNDENNKQITRIKGVIFNEKKELEDYLDIIKKKEKIDHRIIGKKLDLFMFSEKVGIGLPIWLPKGVILKNKLISFLNQKQMELGYKNVITPHIGKKELYVTSGHYDKYKKDSFKPINTKSEQFLIKPMNCPHHCEIYKNEIRSYKDLPIRLAEFGNVYRYEKHGELHGLIRTRGFTQDDAHIFCRPDQVKNEIKNVINLVLYIFKKFKFKKYKIQISLRDKKNKNYIGKEDEWVKSEEIIKEIAKEEKLKTNIKEGESAFYGPKIDFMVKDSLGREWQLGTIQLDYQMPERFKLNYIDLNNKKKKPIIIHRAPFGSLERFIGILIEHTEGKFPLWISPEQVNIIPISEKYYEYSKEIYKVLKFENIECNINNKNEKIGKKIRNSEIKKIPYMIIVGKDEHEKKNISVRKQGKKETKKMKINKFIEIIKKEIRI